MTKYDIAAAIAVEGLDGYYGKMSAAQQRAIFGAAYFGRKTLDIDTTGQGLIKVTWNSGGYPADTLFAFVTFEQVASGTVRLG